MSFIHEAPITHGTISVGTLIVNGTDVESNLVPQSDSSDTGKFLKTDGTSVEWAATDLAGLSDVNLSGLAHDDILQYNSTSSQWENAVLTPPSYAPTLVVDTVNNRVGVNITPTEDFEVDGNIQINSSSTNKFKMYNSLVGHVHAEIDAAGDGVVGNGGELKFLTKESGGSLRENLIIRHTGDVEVPQGEIKIQNPVNATEIRFINALGLFGYGFVKGMIIDNPSDTGANFYCGLRYDAPASSHYCYIGHNPNTTTNGRQIVIETKTSGMPIQVITPGNLFYHYNGTGNYLVNTTGGSTSDDRCKFDETDYTEEEALNDIKQLNFKKYKKVQTILTPEEEAIFEAGGDGLADRTNYEKELAGKPYEEIGLIAQDVPESLKNVLVTEGNDVAMWMVKYDNVIGMCVNCIKNLERRVVELENRV